MRRVSRVACEVSIDDRRPARLARTLRGAAPARVALLLLLAPVMMSACDQLLTGPQAVRTYRSVWINARWAGGRTGSPLNSTADTPSNYEGSLCPASALILENHSNRFSSTLGFSSTNLLVIYNGCSIALDQIAVCASAGSGGTGFIDFMPVCAADPRQTPAGNLFIHQPLPPGGVVWWLTGPNIDVNVFYCAQGSAFALGVVTGARPTDCVPQH